MVDFRPVCNCLLLQLHTSPCMFDYYHTQLANLLFQNSRVFQEVAYFIKLDLMNLLFKFVLQLC